MTFELKLYIIFNIKYQILITNYFEEGQVVALIPVSAGFKEESPGSKGQGVPDDWDPVREGKCNRKDTAGRLMPPLMAYSS